MENNIYDLIIVGIGPAGCMASVYASRYKINHFLIGMLPGGQISEAHKVCNFPGFNEITGMELSQKMLDQVNGFGVERVVDRVKNISRDKNNNFVLETYAKNSYYAKSILLATGASKSKLGLKRESDFVGKGISYCATCDAGFYAGKTVGVVGGSNSATTAALVLSDIAKEVFIIYRGDKFKGDPTWIEQVEGKENITIVLNTNVVELEGQEKLESVKLNNPYRGSDTLKLNGLFVEIGQSPDITLAGDLGIKLDERSHIIVSPDQSTNIEGVFSAGDITTGSNGFRQVITACSEGAIAIEGIYKHLNSKT